MRITWEGLKTAYTQSKHFSLWNEKEFPILKTWQCQPKALCKYFGPKLFNIMVVGVGGLCDLWSTAGILLDSKRKNWKTSVWRGHRWNRFQSFNREKTLQQKFSALCESLRINVLPMGLTRSDWRFECGFVTQEIALYNSALCKEWLGSMRMCISTRETEIYQNTYFIFKRASPFYHLYQLKLLSVIQP